MIGATTTRTPFEITAETTLRDLDRCQMMVWCEGRCGHGSMVWITNLIRRHGLEAKVMDLAPKFKCTRCGGRGRVEIEKLTGIHRPVGNEPYYW